MKRIKQHVRNDLQKQLKETWKNKVMHGKYPESLEKADVDRDQTNIWLKSSGLKPETEGVIIAAQDQCLPTRSYRFMIIKDGTNPMCRLCGKFEETIGHITAGCNTLAVKEYIHRHNRVAAYVHYKWVTTGTSMSQKQLPTRRKSQYFGICPSRPTEN